MNRERRIADESSLIAYTLIPARPSVRAIERVFAAPLRMITDGRLDLTASRRSING
jgi:hypothetical protein